MALGHTHVYGTRFLHLQRSIPYGCCPLVPNFPTELTLLRHLILCAKLRLLLASSEFLDGARSLFAAAYGWHEPAGSSGTR